jgi:Ni,Fe-hydrogenase III component G
MDIRTKTEIALKTAVSLLEPWAETAVYPEENRLDMVVGRDELVTAVACLADNQWGYLAAITGLDHPDPAEGEPFIESLYHFCEGAAVLTLRVAVPRDDAQLPTICAQIPAATIYERELSEMLGVTVTDTPNPDLLYLPDDWQRDTYPLRKDFEAVKREA